MTLAELGGMKVDTFNSPGMCISALKSATATFASNLALACMEADTSRAAFHAIETMISTAPTDLTNNEQLIRLRSMFVGVERRLRTLEEKAPECMPPASVVCVRCVVEQNRSASAILIFTQPPIIFHPIHHYAAESDSTAVMQVQGTGHMHPAAGSAAAAGLAAQPAAAAGAISESMQSIRILTIPGLVLGQPYRFRVRSVAASGEQSEWSPWSGAITAIGPPKPPVITAMTLVDGAAAGWSATVSVECNADSGGSAATQVEIRIIPPLPAPHPSVLQTALLAPAAAAAATMASITFNGLQPRTTYICEARVQNVAGWSEPSVSALPHSLKFGPPKPPTISAVTMNADGAALRATVSVQCDADTGGCAATQVEIRVIPPLPGAFAAVQQVPLPRALQLAPHATTASIIFDGLQFRTAYVFEAKVQNAADLWSEPSAPSMPPAFVRRTAFRLPAHAHDRVPAFLRPVLCGNASCTNRVNMPKHVCSVNNTPPDHSHARTLYFCSAPCYAAAHDF
jgi:hypothetical protein